MKRMLFAIAAALLLTLPAACCMNPGRHGGPGAPGCRQHQGCECKCRQQQQQQPCPKSDCPQQNCPKQQAPAAPAN